MKPEADQILYRSAEQLQLEIAPQLRTGYAQGTVSLVAVLNIMAAQEYERGAEIRKLENDDMRALFRQLAPFAADAELRTRLEAAAATRDASLAISALDAANADLRKLLIALQAHIEDLEGDEARAAERRIWTVLRAAANRRLITLPAF